MLRRYKTAEAAAILGADSHMLKPLRDYGFLTGTKVGHGYTYDSEELEEFIRMTRGYDLSSEQKIAIAAAIIQPKKKCRLPG